MKFLIWNDRAQFIGHASKLEDAWQTTHASFVAKIDEFLQLDCPMNGGVDDYSLTGCTEVITSCWFVHCNEDGRNWYNVPLQQFTLEFFRCRVAAANKSAGAVLDDIESEALVKQIKRWHWKPGKRES